MRNWTVVVTLLRANNIQDGRLSFDDVQYVDKSKVKPKQLLRKGDILICASSGSKSLVGKAALVENDMPTTFGAFCCVLRPKTGESEYFGHYFQSRQYRKAIERACSGSNINNLKAASFESLVVPLYSKTDMLSVVGVLDALVAQKRGAESQLELLDTLVKSRFVEMFGDPCDPDSSKLPGFPLKNICDLRIGPFGSALHKEDYIVGGHPVVNPSHIVDGRIEVDNSLTVGDDKFASMGPYHLRRGDVVLGRRGEIGRCAVVDIEGLLCGTGSMILRPHADVCSSDYLQRVVSFPSFSTSLERQAVGVHPMKNSGATALKMSRQRRGCSASPCPPTRVRCLRRRGRQIEV